MRDASLKMETLRRAEEPELRAAMDRYATGDFSAFELLYDDLAPRLRAMLRRRRCDPALIEDIIQQTFLRMHCARAHYRRGQEVSPWAYAIARHLLIDAWRLQQREARRIERTGRASLPGPEDELIAGETARQLERGFDALPPLHREAFSLVKRDGLSLEQTAQMLGTSVNAIKLRVHRAYRALRGAAQGSK
jgi:RNA polymerase sigma-70 factor (ECF subfamily)